MSIEIYVLSDRRLGSIGEWQQAIDREGFDLGLDTARRFEELSGHLPAQRGGQHAGFECDHWPAADIIENSPDIDFGRPWTHVLAFRVGGDDVALWGAYAAATACARATGGLVFDGGSGEVVSPDKAAATTREIERSLPNG
jgi:hypothetical protein